MTDLRKPARWPELNERYRAEGWGQVAEAALGTYPENVEAQAREIARYAHAEISRARSEYERVLALLVEAREAGGNVLTRGETLEMRKARKRLRNVLSRIDDALAAEPEAKS